MDKGLWFVTLSVVLVGCVGRGEYDRMVQKAQDYESNLSKCDRQRTKQEKTLKENEAQIHLHETLIREAAVDKHNLQIKLDESTAVQEEMRSELQRLGKTFDKERRSYAEARARLAQLRRLEENSKARAALRDELQRKLERMIQSNQVQLVTTGGRIAVVVPSDALFDNGHVEVKNAGKFLLIELAHHLSQIADRRYLVMVHTDGSPPKSPRFPTNVDLAAARAVAIIAMLGKNGLSAQRLLASAAADAMPVQESSDENARKVNRRVEFLVEPLPQDLLPIGEEGP